MKWNDVIGQEKPKGKIEMWFEATEKGEPFPVTCLLGSKGFGKTTLMESIATRLKEINLSQGKELKKGRLVNGSSIKNMKAFWNHVVMPDLKDRDVTLCVDESHELPDEVQTALLTILNPNKEDKNTYTYEDAPVDFDLGRQTIVFATTEPQKMLGPLLNRCEKIDLVPYTFHELSQILRKNVPQIKVDKATLDLMAPVMRGNPRSTVLHAKNLKRFLKIKGRENFTAKDWEEFKQRMDVLPYGITRSELAVLRILSTRPTSSLTRIASSLGLTVQAVRQEVEAYLLCSGWMEIAPGGRCITAAGREILKEVEKVA